MPKNFIDWERNGEKKLWFEMFLVNGEKSWFFSNVQFDQPFVLN